MGIVVKLLLGIVLVVLLAGGGLYVAAQQKPGVAQGLKPIIASAAAAKSFDQKVDSLRTAADEAKRTGKAQPVEVAFTEEELTSKLSQATSSTGSGIATQNTEIHLQGQNIIATSTVQVSGLSVNIGVVATPTVVNGQTQIVVKQIDTGALPLPDALKEQINAQLGTAVSPSKLGLPIDVSQLQVVDGKLVVRGTAKP